MPKLRKGRIAEIPGQSRIHNFVIKLSKKELEEVKQFCIERGYRVGAFMRDAYQKAMKEELENE